MNKKSRIFIFNIKNKLILLRELLWRIKLKRISKRTNFDFDKIYWIKTNKLKYSIIKKENGFYLDRFNIYRDLGKIIDGNWDSKNNRKKIKELDFYKSFYLRFKKNKNWEDTPFYKRVLSEIQGGKIKWGSKNKNDLDKRFIGIDKLYSSIKKEGFKCQKEAGGGTEDEIGVCIGRDGEFLFVNGRHRLSIAKIIGIKYIPVRIIVVHKKWLYKNLNNKKKLIKPFFLI